MSNKQERVERQATIIDIANKLKKDPSTVSRALSGSPRISDRTKEEVARVAAELNYIPNRAAARLRSGRSKVVGVIVPRLNHHFFSEAIYGMEAKLKREGYNLIICQSNENYVEECDAVRSLLSSQVDGIIISLSSQTKNFEHLQYVLDSGVPLVQFDRVTDELNTPRIVNDNFEGGYKAVNHLLSGGYRKIGVLHGGMVTNVYRERLEGVHQALEDAGIKSNKALELEAFTEKDGYNAAKKLLANGNGPDAIFCCSDHTALGVLEYAKEANISVPSELGVLGYANELFTRVTNPSLSTVDQQCDKLGRQAASVLLKRLTFKSMLNVEEPIKSSLIIRDSSVRAI
ncbi:LacI family DNA-binding transcriptional regulator [Marinoscillum sp. MHG1-6]|uniref:LacI family DNA-binding transcriptional regulator n=1 Tax=Marinoscillum sp. MHG1-6 TaxID=2959627 RepID=UPI002156FE1A|nr:LacI family DNA-binding transcriptional regulator [Marinoscillum sp. MHG1-6]